MFNSPKKSHEERASLLNNQQKTYGENSSRVESQRAVDAPDPDLARKHGMALLEAIIEDPVIESKLNECLKAKPIDFTVTMRDSAGLTPLEYAAVSGEMAIYDMLLQSGAKQSECDVIGSLQRACNAKTIDLDTFRERLLITSKLLPRVANEVSVLRLVKYYDKADALVGDAKCYDDPGVTNLAKGLCKSIKNQVVEKIFVKLLQAPALEATNYYNYQTESLVSAEDLYKHLIEKIPSILTMADKISLIEKAIDSTESTQTGLSKILSLEGKSYVKDLKTKLEFYKTWQARMEGGDLANANNIGNRSHGPS